jgi:diadenylate cyclase
MGSRHRAGLGISEKSDSCTIIVSEKTGGISICVGGVMLSIPTRETLIDYLETYIK